MFLMIRKLKGKMHKINTIKLLGFNMSYKIKNGFHIYRGYAWNRDFIEHYWLANIMSNKIIVGCLHIKCKNKKIKT